MISFDDVRTFDRCPYAYRLDKTEAFPDKITLSECLSQSVRDAIHGCSERRIIGYRIDEESILESFWNQWDRYFTKVYNPNRDDPMQFIRIGEKCIRNFVSLSSEYAFSGIVASFMQGTLVLSDGVEIRINAEEVGRKNSTVTITKYISSVQVEPNEKLESDFEMNASALWAMNNLNAEHVVRRWVFLLQKVTSEIPADKMRCIESMKDLSARIKNMDSENPLPRESEYCPMCPYQSRCPRFLHELSVMEKGPDEGVRLADEYLEIEKKKQALKNRIELLNAEQDLIKAKIVAFSDSNGYMSIKGNNGKLLIRHEKKVELPDDKTEIVERLKITGQYDSLSIPNYPRLRSDIAKGVADPVIIKMANIVGIDKIYIKKEK